MKWSNSESTFLKQSVRLTVNSIDTFPAPALSLQSVHSGFPPSKQEDIMAPLCAHGDLTVMMMSFSRAPLAASHVRQVSLVIALHHRPQSDSLCLTQRSYTNIMQYKNIEVIAFSLLHGVFHEHFPDVPQSC